VDITGLGNTMLFVAMPFRRRHSYSVYQATKVRTQFINVGRNVCSQGECERVLNAFFI